MAAHSHDIDLKELLEHVGRGKLQLPEFQRLWVWDDTKICKLIESVTMNYPMGALMFLETGGVVNYKPRLFTGVDESNASVKPDFLVLDGQQRLTTLYQVFMSKKPVETCLEKGRNKSIQRYYYLDIKKALDENEDREDAIISIPANKRITKDIGRTIELDLSTREKEFEGMKFPLNLLFSDECHDWLDDMEEYNVKNLLGDTNTYREYRRKFRRLIVEPVTRYDLPVIMVDKDTSLASVCQIFENVNRGGEPLDVFDLVTASLAASDIELKKEWEAIEVDFDKHRCKLLDGVTGTAFITSMTLWESYEQHLKEDKGVKCKKKDVLKLNRNVFLSKRDGMKRGFIDAANFLVQQGIYSPKHLPYSTQFIPMAAIFAFDNSHNKVLGQATNLSKLAKWYWCGVFGEMYGAANESRYALDIRNFFDWVYDDSKTPDTVTRSNFQATRLLSLHSRISAAYKGIMALILHESPKDFATTQDMSIATFIEENTDIHHIFPADYCYKKFPEEKFNSVVNKTMINASTNRSIGGVSPSKYIQRLFKGKSEADVEKMKDSIRSHLIDFDLLNEDRFDEFINDRAIKLLNLIEKATGKAVSGRDSQETIDAFGAMLV